MYKIDKGTTLPKERVKWPWSIMDVGDRAEFSTNIAKSQRSCHVYGHKFGRKFVTQKSGSILHVWRVE